VKDNYDLKNPRPNPYAERMKNGYTIIIECEPDEGGKDYETKIDESRTLQTSRQGGKVNYRELGI
jgi:hypothetical protein